MSLPSHRSSGSFVFVPATVLEWAPTKTQFDVNAAHQLKMKCAHFEFIESLWMLSMFSEESHLVQMFPEHDPYEQLHSRLQVWQVTPLPLQLHVIQHHQHRPHPARYRSERERPEANVDFYNILETATFKVFKNVHLGTCQRQVNGAVRNERTRDYTNSIYWYWVTHKLLLRKTRTLKKEWIID